METVYTPEEVADMLKLKIKHVQKLCREGKLPAFKAGNVWRITESGLKEFMNRTTVSNGTEKEK